MNVLRARTGADGILAVAALDTTNEPAGQESDAQNDPDEQPN